MKLWRKQLFSLAGLLGLSLSLGLSSAQAFELNYSVRGSTYGVTGTETAADLINTFHQGAPIYCDQQSLTSFTNVATGTTCGTGNTNLADLLELTVNFGQQTQISFEIGTDWGRGGAVIVDGNLDYITTDDIWWSYNWANADVISTVVDLGPGAHTLQWIGFESCCNGNRSIRFNAGDGWQDLSAENFAGLEASEVPAPMTLGLMLAGLFGFARRFQQA